MPNLSAVLATVLFAMLHTLPQGGAPKPPAAPAGAGAPGGGTQGGSNPQGNPNASGGPRGAAPLFDKKERTDFTKKVVDFLDARAKLAEAKSEFGTDNQKYKDAEKALRKAETALETGLKPLAKKYSLDSECLTAATDWQSAVSDYHVKRAAYTKGNISVGSEQAGQLRDEPKANFTRRIPKTYDPQKQAWPLLVIVQDKGKLSKQVTTEELKLPAILDGEGDLQGHVTLSIDVPESAWDDSFKLYASVLKPLRELRSVVRIDPNRILIGGIGHGAKAAAEVARFAPHFFSGFFAKGGDPGDVRPENFVNLPVYLMGDSAGWDKEIAGATEGSREKWLAVGKAAGVDITVDPESKLADFAAWLGKRARNPYALQAKVAVKTDKRQSAACWLAYDPDPAREAKIVAKVDRATNTIEVQSDGVTRYYLFLSDALLDLSKVVTIKTNDKEWSGKLPPVKGTMLNCIDEFGTLDRGMVYTVSYAVDVPRAKKGS